MCLPSDFSFLHQHSPSAQTKKKKKKEDMAVCSLPPGQRTDTLKPSADSGRPKSPDPIVVVVAVSHNTAHVLIDLCHVPNNGYCHPQRQRHVATDGERADGIRKVDLILTPTGVAEHNLSWQSPL